MEYSRARATVPRFSRNSWRSCATGEYGTRTVPQGPAPHAASTWAGDQEESS